MPSYIFLKYLAIILRFYAKHAYQIPPPHPTSILSIPSRTPNRSIPVHLYSRSTSTSNSPSPSPVLLNLSGSGFTIPSLGSDAPFINQITAHTRYTVLDVGYRLAPEHPFPAAIEDLVDVLSYVHNHPEQFDQAKIAICGFSAGGNLAVSVAANYPASGIETLVAFYPVVDASIPDKVKERRMGVGAGKKIKKGMGGVLPVWLLGFYRRCYLRGGRHGSGERLEEDDRVSPGRAGARLAGFPDKCLFVTCEWDSLARETEELGQRLMESPGRDVRMVRVEGCGHAWDKIAKEGTKEWDERERAYQAVVDMLKDD
ncbi:alpha/beta-hydrolase [Aspergillus sclerotioniger CBS 115572]|uniref:Alpha/beta-hydrolase n=1 Tax=Aspergillus sclerotioniger CBS 115572 TaxID=1450535 RepID=A0A317X8U4_9EURO|nr:alpha/beta-hydrolase [Aspergillus sclerotioniger CBS 115572]PWY94705.1 alpha/beta-hydrolase [Aspergillus sclerotioniger CBS 115572]